MVTASKDGAPADAAQLRRLGFDHRRRPDQTPAEAGGRRVGVGPLDDRKARRPIDANGDVQIKMTAGDRIAMYGRLVLLRAVSPREAEIVFDGDRRPA